jgi:putative ABC transport system permease protein
MIMLPVLALSFAAVTDDMFSLTDGEKVDRKVGQYDAWVEWMSDKPMRQTPKLTTWDAVGSDGSGTQPREGTPDLLKLFPAGSTAVPYTDSSSSLKVTTRHGVTSMETRPLDLADKKLGGIVRLVAGSAPTGPAQIALTASAASRIGVSVGGTVRLVDGDRTVTVVGLAEFADDLGPRMVLWPDPSADSTNTWLVSSPTPITWASVKELNRHGIVAYARNVVLDPPPASQVDLPLDPSSDASTFSVVGIMVGLGVLEVILLAGPAFAIGARRRSRDLALVAANGGTPPQLRRIVLADGVVLGAVGAVVGVVLGVVLALVGRPLLEVYVAHRLAGGYRFYPSALAVIATLAVVTGILAALVPAFTAARQDVIAVLARRRGVTRSKRRWVLLGLALLVAGVTGSLYGVSRLNSNLMQYGLIVAEMGLVLCTPALIGLISRAGSVLPLAPRIALRDAARNRAAAAPAVAAVMAAVAGSVALGVYLAGSDSKFDNEYRRTMPPGYVMVTSLTGTTPDGKPIPSSAAFAAAVRQALPVRAYAEISFVACPTGTDPSTSCDIGPQVPADRLCPADDLPSPLTAAQQKAALQDPRCRSKVFSISGPTLVVDDGSALPLVSGATGADLARATATLKSGGVVTTDGRLVEDGTTTLAVYTSSANGDSPAPRTISVPGYVLTSAAAQEMTVVSPGAVGQAKMRVRRYGIVVATEHTPTQAEQDKLTATTEALGNYPVTVEHPPTHDTDAGLLVLAGVAGFIALGAAAIATGLGAVDSKPDLATLAAVGASPGLRRRLSLSQAGVIAGLGSVLGAVAGFGAAVAVMSAYNRLARTKWPIQEELPIHVPWWNLLIALVIVPGVAMLGAGLLTRSRLPIERRI